MKLTETAQIPAEQFNDAIGGNFANSSVTRKQYLDSARGHYLSALAGVGTGKLELTRFYASTHASSMLEDYPFEQVAEAEVASTPGRVAQLKSILDKNMKTSKTLKKQLRSVQAHLHRTLDRKTEAQTVKMVDRLGVFGKELSSADAEEIDAMQTGPSDCNFVKDYLPNGVAESSSLQKRVESLKAQLENLKKEHAELEENDVAAELATKNQESRLVCCQPENACLAKKAQSLQNLEQLPHGQNEAGDQLIEAKSLKRKRAHSNSYSEVEKRQRGEPVVEDLRKGTANDFDQNKSLPDRTFVACMSTSESSAKVMNSEDELESSCQRPEKSEKSNYQGSTVFKRRIEADKCDFASEFSIRDFVFSARNKDISTNWPFSEKNLYLCLKNGVKNVLPPFRSMDSFRDASVKQYVAAKSLPSEESACDGRPSETINNVVAGPTGDRSWNRRHGEGYRDSDLLPSGGEKDLAFNMIPTTNSQSEVGSVSTSNLPLSEVVSDDREAAVSAVNTSKSSASQISNKKSRLQSKLRLNSSRYTPEDITSACTVPSETMTSKICPVCEKFSSSSNTTLNAHIDQCLSSQSTPNWVMTSKLIKPRVKPRKIRLMADICASAPRCTLEDLNNRNGTNWAIDADLLAEDSEVPAEGTSRGVSPKFVVKNSDDDSVYIDSNGRKIRILSKFNDMLPSSCAKKKMDLKLKKQSRKYKRSKFLPAERKRRVAKHLRFLRVSLQRRRLSSVNVKSSPYEASRVQETACGVRERRVQYQSSLSFAKGLHAEEHKKPNVIEKSSRWIYSKTAKVRREDKSEGTFKTCRYDLRTVKNSRIGGNRAATGRMVVRKHARLPKKPLLFFQRSLSTLASDSGEAVQKSPKSCDGNTVAGSSPRGVDHGSEDEKKVKNCVSKYLHSKSNCAATFGRDVEIESVALRNNDSGSRKLLLSCHVHPFEGVRSHNLEADTLSPKYSYVRASQSPCKQKGSALESIYGCSEDEVAEAWSTDTRERCVTKHGLDCSLDGSRNIDSANELDGGRDIYGFVRSDEMSHEVPVSSTGLAITESAMNLSTSLDSGLQKVAGVFDPPSKSLSCLNKFQGPSYREGSKIFSSHGCLSDVDEMLNGHVTAAAIYEPKAGDAILNFQQGITLIDVDPIPIPGPPGSDLPSFSDMGSEDDDSVVNGDFSDSPVSMSMISNLVADDPTGNEQGYLRSTLPIFENISSGWLGANSRSALSPCPMANSGGFTSVFDASKEGLFFQDRCRNTQSSEHLSCCRSDQEGIPCSVMSFPGSQLLGPRTAVTPPGAKCTDSSSTEWPNSLNSSHSMLSNPGVLSQNIMNSVQILHQSLAALETSAEATLPFPRSCDSDSGSPAPVLRLMGKNLTVVNKEEADLTRSQAAQNVCVRRVHPVTELSSTVEGNWEHLSPQCVGILGTLPYEQGRLIFPAQNIDAGSSNVTNNFRSSNHSLDNMCVSKLMHSGFSVLGASPLQR